MIEFSFIQRADSGASPLLSDGGSSPMLTDRSDVHRPGSHPNNPIRFYVQPCVAEFFATFMFVFVGTVSCESGDSLQIAVTHGLGIAVLVEAFSELRSVPPPALGGPRPVYKANVL
jgi:hypothetical protein